MSTEKDFRISRDNENRHVSMDYIRDLTDSDREVIHNLLDDALDGDLSTSDLTDALKYFCLDVDAQFDLTDLSDKEYQFLSGDCRNIRITYDLSLMDKD